MNILYIIGNGFDRAQGMATSYPEFYKYLLENKEGSPLLQKMKIEIKEDLDAKENGKISNKIYQEINHVSKRTATSDLYELVGKHNLMENIGVGAGSHYKLIGQ